MVPDTDEYITLRNDNWLTRANHRTGEETWSIKTRADTIFCPHAVTADAIALAEHTDERNYRVVLHNLQDGGATPTKLEHGAFIRGIAFSVDRSLLVSASNDRYLRVLDLQTQSIIWEQENDVEAAFGVAVHPNNDYIAVGCMRGIKIWSLKEKRLVASWNAHSHYVESLKFSSNGKYLLSGSTDKSAALWKTEDLIGIRQYVSGFRLPD